jgi:hypothetical protein
MQPAPSIAGSSLVPSSASAWDDHGVSEQSESADGLIEVLGSRFLGFALNAPADVVEDNLRAGALDETQARTVAQLSGLVRAVSAQDERSITHSLCGALGQHREELGSSWASAVNRENGGNPRLPEAQTELEVGLLKMVRDVYPLFLLPKSPDRFPFSGPELSSVLYRHPDRPGFDQNVLKDEGLAKLFPVEDQQSGRHGVVRSSTGWGRGIQLALFADEVVRSGWRIAEHRHGTPTLEEFATEVIRALDFARGAAEGRNLSITALVGIAGVRLADVGTLNLPWGGLRAVTPRDEEFIPPGLAGKLGTTTAEGTPIEIDYAGDLVMQFEVPYAIQITSSYDAAPERWPVELAAPQIVEHNLESLRLGLLFSSERRPRPTVTGTWRVFLDPIGFGGGTSWTDPRQLPSLRPSELGRKEAQAWEGWTARVDAHRVPGIEIALKRTLSAAAERGDPSDALIDAVIAWENLVGSSEGEPTLRVSAALAWLLGANGDERRDLRRRISKLYGLRSKIVHGDRVLAPDQAETKREEAVDIAIWGLKRLFAERVDLLHDCKDSNERSLKLILDETASRRAR